MTFWYWNITELDDGDERDDENATFQDIESDPKDEIISSETEKEITASNSETEESDYDEETIKDSVEDKPTSF